MEEDEDDLYGTTATADAPELYTSTNASGQIKQELNGHDQLMNDDAGAGNDEESEEEDDDESDIDIITERKDAAPVTTTQEFFKRVKQEPVRIATASDVVPTKSSASAKAKTEISLVQGGKLTVKSGLQFPDHRSSTIDIDSIPMYDEAGKPITEIDLDADVAAEIKPWRVPGTDPTDYFNYGFDEFTWVQYCLKQKHMKESIGELKDETKQFEAMLSGQGQSAVPSMPTMPNMPNMPNMPGMPGMGGMGGMPGMPDMNPEMMNAMFNSMQAQGLSDPSQLDFGAFMQQMQQMGGNMPGMSGMPNMSGMSGMPGMPGMQGGFGPGQHNAQFGNNFGMPAQGQGFGGPQNGFPPQQPPSQTQAPTQGLEGFSPQQLAMLQQQQGGGAGRGRGRGRGRW